MGRGHLTRAARFQALGAAAVAAAALAASSSAGLSWYEVAAGSTPQASSHVARAYLALTKTQERVWTPRLSTRDRATIARVNLSKTILVAAFLDGAPCSTRVVATGVTRRARTLAVSISYTLPPVGISLCIRSSTPYVIVGIPRASLGGVKPNRISLILHARS
ncbi:MAG TPA: hypothetical protein VGH52_00750 [Gaiellaceae bacterium]